VLECVWHRPLARKHANVRRYAEIPFDRMTPEQQVGYRFLVDGPRGRLPGPYKVWVHNPKLVHAAER
jgi:4-carboxymuconolactone decarboxylase